MYFLIKNLKFVLICIALLCFQRITQAFSATQKLESLLSQEFMKYVDSDTVPDTASTVNLQSINEKDILTKNSLSASISAYFYMEYYLDNSCDSQPTYAIGYSTNSCLKLYSAANIAVGSMYGVCTSSGFNFIFYNDTTCTNAKKSANYGALNQCLTASGIGSSVKLMCSPVTTTLPLSFSSVAVTGYPRGNADCSLTPSIFAAYNLNDCLNSTGSYSQLKCSGKTSGLYFTNQTISRVTYSGAGKSQCSSSTTVTTAQPSGCLATGSDSYNIWNDFVGLPISVSSVTSEVFSGRRNLRENIPDDTELQTDSNLETYYYGSEPIFDHLQVQCFRAPLRTSSPTNAPTSIPSSSPTSSFTTKPSRNPTQRPSRLPTISPTSAYSQFPTIYPSFKPTALPTIQPSFVVIVVLSNLNYNDYLQKPQQYVTIFENALVQSVTGLNISQIISLEVSLESSSRRKLLASDSFSLVYTISYIPGSQVTSLKSSVVGAFIIGTAISKISSLAIASNITELSNPLYVSVSISDVAPTRQPTSIPVSGDSKSSSAWNNFTSFFATPLIIGGIAGAGVLTISILFCCLSACSFNKINPEDDDDDSDDEDDDKDKKPIEDGKANEERPADSATTTPNNLEGDIPGRTATVVPMNV